MKILALIFLIGVAAAISHKDLERARDEAVLGFLVDMEKAPSLREAMNMPHAVELDEIENDIKNEVRKALLDTLEHLLQKFKDAIDHGKQVKEEVKENMKKVVEALKNLHIEYKDKVKEFVEKMKDKAKTFLQRLLEKLGIKTSEYSEVYQSSIRDHLDSFKEIFKEALEKLKKKGADVKVIVDECIEKVKGIGSAVGSQIVILLKKIRDSSVEKARDFFNIFLGKHDGGEERRAVKDYISSFKEWLNKIIEAGKDKIEGMKKVAEKFLHHVKEVGKKTADEVLELLRPYKEDLGALYERLRKAIKDTYGEY